MTSNGRIILDIINESNDHLTAEDIFMELRKRSVKMVLATVYNNLNTLCREGLVRRIAIEGQPERFDRVKRHDHLVCSECGKISDICLDDYTEKFQKDLHFHIESYDLKVFYLCDECRKKEEEHGYKGSH